MTGDWYLMNIESPMIQLIRDLRNNGFNTVWCCAHGPKPYVAIDLYRLNEEVLLEMFLTEYRYKNYKVSIEHYGANDKDMLTISFKTDKKEHELINSEELGGKLEHGLFEL